MSGETGVLSLGGVAIPDAARLDWSQTRSTLSSETTIEYSDMTCEVQAGPTTTVKRQVALACAGWMPPGIDALVRTSTHSFSFEVPSGLNTWTTATMTVWIIERAQYRDDLRAPGGGSVAWTLTLREA